MNAAQLQAWIAAHQKPVAAAAAAGVVGLGLLARKKKAAAGSAGAGGFGGVGTGSTAATWGPAMAGTAAAPDTSVVDGYNDLQSQIYKLTDALTAPPPTPTVAAPIASTIFAPTGTGNYVHFGGIGGEVESDGSIFGITQEQWAQIVAKDPTANSKITKLSSGPAQWWSTETNVKAATAPKTS